MQLGDLQVLRVRLRATRALELPCLPTVLLRSVLGMALRQASCVMPERQGCAGCEAAASCAYGMLLEPGGSALRELGVTERGPSPMVLSPEGQVVDGSAVRVAAGKTLDVRVVLLGRARSMAELVVAALRSGVTGGVGRARVPMAVEAVRSERVVGAAPGDGAELELLTPLRLTSDGKVRARFGAEELLKGLARRVDTLSRLYDAEGAGRRETPPLEGVALEGRDVRVVHVKRWSGRQKAGMDLPGVVGTLELRGNVAPWWPWLALGEWVQLGKGTSMGFGRYRLRGVCRTG